MQADISVSWRGFYVSASRHNHGVDEWPVLTPELETACRSDQQEGFVMRARLGPLLEHCRRYNALRLEGPIRRQLRLSVRSVRPNEASVNTIFVAVQCGSKAEALDQEFGGLTAPP
jgi:hypothetical protein